MAKSDEVKVSVVLVDKVTQTSKKIKASLDKTFTGVEQSAGGATSAIGKLAGPLGVAGLGVALGAVAMKAIRAKAQFEKLEMQFETLLGSSTAAKERMEELAQFAASTPFQIEGIAKASKILESLTQGALSTGDGLRMVGDAAAIAGVPIDELAVHIGRAQDALSNGRPAGEAISRMQELGLISGKTRGKIEELQKQAKGEEAWKVLQESLGKTSGSMAKLADTFDGKLSTLMDNIDGLYRAMLNDNAFLNFKGGIENLIELTQTWTTLLGGNLTTMEKLAQKTNKTAQDELMLVEARKESIKAQIADTEAMAQNGWTKKRLTILNKKLAEQDAVSNRLAKLAAKENKELNAELEKKAKNKGGNAKANDDEAKSLENLISRQKEWKEELKKETENTEKEDRSLELTETQKILKANEEEIKSNDAILESRANIRFEIAKDQEFEANIAEQKEKNREKELKEEEKLAKRKEELIKKERDIKIKSITDNMKWAKSGFLFSKALFGENKKLAMSEAIIMGALAVQKAWVTGNMANVALATASTAYNVSQIAKAETGADFETNGPQMLMVGDNPGGKERVQVTPINSPNENGPTGNGGGGVTVNFTLNGNADESTLNGFLNGIDGFAKRVEAVIRNRDINLMTLGGEEIVSV